MLAGLMAAGETLLQRPRQDISSVATRICLKSCDCWAQISSAWTITRYNFVFVSFDLPLFLQLFRFFPKGF